jgi:hypothetical protein
MNLRGVSVVDASPAKLEVRDAIPLGDAFGKCGGISMTFTCAFYLETNFETASKQLTRT